MCAEQCSCAVAETDPNKKMASVLGLDNYWLVLKAVLVPSLSYSYTSNSRERFLSYCGAFDANPGNISTDFSEIESDEQEDEDTESDFVLE